AALRALAPDFVPRVVLADADEAKDGRLADAVREWGAVLIAAPMRETGRIDRHDHALLSAQYARAFAEVAASGSVAPG
ncbi:MAG: hypothetical protein ABUL56_02775, partial [Actinomycetota bacterium]